MRESDNLLLLEGLLDLAMWKAQNADPGFMAFEYKYLMTVVLNRMNR